LTPVDAARLLDDEAFGRMTVHDLSTADRLAMMKAAARHGTAGGRIYDAHIAEVARAAGARRSWSPTIGAISWPRCGTACEWKRLASS
jgi:hypothetical protein